MTLPTIIVPYIMIHMSLQSGSKATNLDINILDCGNELVMKHAWPNLLLNTELLLNRYTNEYSYSEYASNHVVVAGFHRTIRKLKT